MSDTTPPCCPHCYAVYPADAGPLHAMAIGAYLRRAMEVALTGHHPITFVEAGNPAAAALAHYARAHGLTSYVTRWCPCGQRVHPEWADHGPCTCTLGAIQQWQQQDAYQVALLSDLIMTVVSPNLADAPPARADSDPILWERITTTWAHPRPAPVLDATARHFLAAAVRQLAPTAQQVTRVVHVARTIAWVQAQPCLTTAAIAEAWQYQRGRPRSPVLEPTGTEAKGGRNAPPHAV